jgi:hypothetical protein
MGHSEVQVEHLLLGLFSKQQSSDERPPFSPLAKDVLRSAYRFGTGEAGAEHILIVLMTRSEDGAYEILRLLGRAEQLRFKAKKRALTRDAEPTPHQLRATARPMLPELAFGD